MGYIDPTTNNVVANAATQTCTSGYVDIPNGFRYANGQGSPNTSHVYYVYKQVNGSSLHANPTCVGAGCGSQSSDTFRCNTSNGPCTFGVSYTDNNGQTVTVTGSFSAGQTSEPQLTVSGGGFDAQPLTTTQAVPSTTLTFGTAATPFTPVTSSGGTPTVSYSISPSLTPVGLTFSTTTGQITGTPTAAATATTYTVTATDSTSGTAQTSSNTFSLTINKANQTVAFTSNPSSPAVGGTYTPSATATSGLTPVITVDATSSSICSIAGGVVTFNAAGSCVLNANRTGNANYNDAAQVQQPITIGKGGQTVSFTSTAPVSPIVGGTYAVTATASSGLTATITVDGVSAAICSIAGNTVTFNATGSCVIDANQNGNSNYNSASQVQQSLTIGKASPGVGLVASTSSPLFNTPVTFTATLTGGVTPTGTITFKDGAAVLGTVALSGASASLTISSLTAGAHSVVATYSGDAKNSVMSSSAASISVGTRADPGTSAAVRGIVTSQVTSAIRFGQAQTTNITSRLEQLHDEDGGGVSPIPEAGTGAFADPRTDRQTFSNRFGSASGNTAGSVGTSDVASDPFSFMTRRDALGQNSSSGPVGSGPMGTGPMGAMAYAADDPLITGRRTTQDDSSRAMSQLASALPGALNAFNKYSGLPFHIWASGTVGFGNLNDGTTSNRFTTSGVTVGFDGKVTDNFKAGVALGLAFDRTTLGNDGSKSESTSYSGALYASWRFMPRTYLDFTGGLASLRSDMVRFDSNGGVFLNGRRDGTNLFGSVALTHNERYGAWKISPYLRLDAVQTSLNAYAETGSAVWALTYDRMTANTVNGIIGSRVSYRIPEAWGTLTPGARFEYRHAFESGFSQTLNYADLVGVAPGYNMAGTSVSRDAFTTALMVSADMINGWKADFEYLVTASNLGVEGHRLRLVGGYRF